METRPVVTCFLRHEGEVLLLRRSSDVGSYPGLWGAVAGYVAADEEDPTAPTAAPAAAAYREIAEETKITNPTLVRAGEAHEVVDDGLGVTCRFHPFLFEVGSREVETKGTAAVEWTHPPAILRRDTVPQLWRSYEHVRPRLATVRDDHTHGSTWLSLRALELLRDEAALAIAGRDPEGDDREPSGGPRSTGGRADDRDVAGAERAGNGWDDLAALARDLRRLRPSMAVLTNRVNRAMHAAADEGTPTAIEDLATAGIERAVAADREAAAVAADRLPDAVATLSRSGTVSMAIRERTPSSVLVAESRPGGEGVPVAESLAAAGVGDVALTSDAAFPALVAERNVSALVVGADRVLPDGDVLNKVGTRSAALAAPEECTVLAVTASDKIAQDDAVYVEERDRSELYDGDAPITVANPTFDLTPASAIDAVATERGILSPTSVRDVAAEHAVYSEW